MIANVRFKSFADSRKLFSLLLFAAVSNVHSSIAKQSPKPWQPNTRKVNSYNDDLKNCICYPDGQLPTVHQLLDKQNNGQERLVVYLYKNDATNEIKMYIPNANKQMLIPDIPYESGDGLTTVTTEYVYTLLYNNPNKIKVYNDHMETLIPTVTDSLPIGLNTGAIEHILPNTENYLNPNNAYKGNEYILAKNTVVAYGPNGEVVNIPQEGSSNILPVSYDYENLNILEQYGLTNNYPYTKPINPQAIPLIPKTVPGNAQAVPEEPLAVPLNPQFPSYNPQVVSVNTQSLPLKLQAFPENPQDFPGNPQAVPANPQAFSTSYVGGIDEHVVYSFQADQGSNKLSSDSNDIHVSHSTQYVTFNIWFKQQMKRFKNLHLPKDIKTIDNNVLRILVQKTLRENNIYVSVDGVITDAKGIVIDAANLELRPLLLGETFNYQILQNAQKAIKLPKHLPYLEGILVTLVSPPQILGIIPLGKTYLPETSDMAQQSFASVNGSKIYVNGYGNAYSASPEVPYMTVKEIYAEPTAYYAAYSGANGVPTSQISYSDTYNKGLAVAYPYTPANTVPQLGVSEVNYWSSGPYNTASKLPYPTANWNPSELSQPLGQRRKISEAKIEHHYEPPVRTRKRGKGIKKLTKEEVVEITTVEPFLSINASESGRRFPSPSLAGVMKTLLYLLNDLPSRRGLNSTGDADILNESEGNNDGGAPDFRIIGGNAATGSGTPLSNKGRSGSTENA